MTTAITNCWQTRYEHNCLAYPIALVLCLWRELGTKHYHSLFLETNESQHLKERLVWLVKPWSFSTHDAENCHLQLRCIILRIELCIKCNLSFIIIARKHEFENCCLDHVPKKTSNKIPNDVVNSLLRFKK
jgi:hypothetical protein